MRAGRNFKYARSVVVRAYRHRKAAVAKLRRTDAPCPRREPCTPVARDVAASVFLPTEFVRLTAIFKFETVGLFHSVYFSLSI